MAGPHAVVATRALSRAGIGPNAVTRRVRDGRLTRVFRGVYRVGPVDGSWTREAAALLACGGSAVLSHGSAGAVWGIVPRGTGDVDVTITDGHRAGQSGIRVHHAPLEPSEIRERSALRLTSPARTLLDLAVSLGQRDLDWAVNEAQVQGLASLRSLHAHVARHERHRGARALARALQHEPRITRSELERRMLDLVRRIGLPAPRSDTRVRGHLVDFLWPDARLVVEMDGYRTHGTRQRFETDRRRDAELTAVGYRVLRFSWRQLVREPEIVAARLAAALARS